MRMLCIIHLQSLEERKGIIDIKREVRRKLNGIAILKGGNEVFIAGAR